MKRPEILGIILVSVLARVHGMKKIRVTFVTRFQPSSLPFRWVVWLIAFSLHMYVGIFTASGQSSPIPCSNPPGAMTLVSPSGTIRTSTPTYTWNAVPCSSWYYLWVDDVTGTRVQRWYTATEAGCPSCTGTCSVTPSVPLNGTATWWVQPWDNAGYGPWSTFMNFNVACSTAPAAVTLISPSGTIRTSTPTYTWNAVPCSSWYYLWVDDVTGTRVQRWYTATEAGCPSCTGTCSVTPSVPLNGTATWWVQPWDSAGYGPWSTFMNFNVNANPCWTPGKAPLVSPSGPIRTSTPTYTWNAVPCASWYYLWVNDSSGTRIQEWYRAADACPLGTGTCSVRPPTALADGTATWWIETWGNGDYGPWSSGMNFNVNTSGSQPCVTLDTPAPGATQLSGHACNIDPTKIKVVIYVLTNQWYVQPLIIAPFTNIAADGSWTSSTHPWQSIVVLLVDPANYTVDATKITNPGLDPGVLAWTEYPPGPVSVSLSGRTWGIKVTGNAPNDQFDPGPNFWSSDPSVVHVAGDGLHLKITQINGNWQCGEVYLLESLGYGTYTVQVSSHLENLDQNTVAAPLFIYAAPGQELDNEYSGTGGLIPNPYNAQFVVQPYTVPGNIFRYVQPPNAQFTSQMEWRADHVTFSTWNGWTNVPADSDFIRKWTYTGPSIPSPGQERVHINLWLLNGSTPVGGIGDEMVIRSFTFQP